MGKKWLFLMVRHLGNHEFPDYEKNSLDLDFLLFIRCAFLHEFPFFKIKQHAGNCFTRYLQPRGKQFPDKQFLCLLRNHNECCAWILKHLQHWTSHMTLKKSNLGIHDVSKHLNRKIDSQLDQIIFDPGIHDADKKVVKKVLKSFHDPSLPWYNQNILRIQYRDATLSCGRINKSNNEHANL